MNAKNTLKDFEGLKKAGKKFAVLACYDYITAKIASTCGIEALLVGDSAAQVVLGYPSTQYAKMDFMLEITAAVKRAAPNCLIIADMPFLSYQTGKAKALKNASKFITKAGANIIKIETDDTCLETVDCIANAGVPVMTHIGIRPQTGIYSAKGRNVEQALELVSLAERSIEAGASMLLLEGVAAEVAEIITEKCPVPVIGCGSGKYCDGNVLIAPDILGLSEGKKPKFAKQFADIKVSYKKALTEYARQIKNMRFPDSAHSYHIEKTDLKNLKQILEQNMDF